MNKIIFILSLLINLNLYAKTGPITGLDIPRFVSIKSNDVNLRVGPSMNYPIKLKYIKRSLPVEIVDEFDVWRKIKDYEDNTGWVHKSLITGERFVLTGVKKKNINIYNRPKGKIIGIVKKNNILSLESCLLKWCFCYNSNVNGWLSKNDIWGVYEKEIYNQSFYQPIITQYWKILDSKWLK